MRLTKKEKTLKAIDAIIINLSTIKRNNPDIVEKPLCDIYHIKLKSCTNCPISNRTSNDNYKGCIDHDTWFKSNEVKNVSQIKDIVLTRIKYFKKVREILEVINFNYFNRMDNRFSKITNLKTDEL